MKRLVLAGLVVVGLVVVGGAYSAGCRHYNHKIDRCLLIQAEDECVRDQSGAVSIINLRLIDSIGTFDQNRKTGLVSLRIGSGMDSTKIEDDEKKINEILSAYKECNRR